MEPRIAKKNHCGVGFSLPLTIMDTNHNFVNLIKNETPSK